MSDTETRATVTGEGGLHRDGDKAAIAKYIHWALVIEAGMIWAQNNRATEEYPEGKYPDEDGVPNFMLGIQHTKIADSLLRHIIAWLMGENVDPESRQTHLAHAMCCLNMLSFNVAEHPELDDRPCVIICPCPQHFPSITEPKR